QTTGQGQRDQSSKQKSSNQNRSSQTSGQGQHDQTSGQGQRESNRQGSNGHVELNVQQRTQIREQVFARGNVPRVDHVNFSLNVGTTQTRSVHIVTVPSALVTIHPELRGREYFVVREDIYIGEPGSPLICAGVPVGTCGPAP